MKNYYSEMKRFFIGLFSTFGILEFVFFIRGFFPNFGFSGTTLMDTILCLGASLIFTISHTVISSEFLDQYLSVRVRELICGIPCFIILVVLTVASNIHSLVAHLFGFNNELSASVTWVVSFAFCLLVVGMAYFFIEKSSYKTEKQYDLALAEYKKKQEANG